MAALEGGGSSRRFPLHSQAHGCTVVVAPDTPAGKGTGMTWHPKNPVVQPDGTKLWYRFRQTHTGITFALHRTDGPAIIHPDGSLFWYRNGLLHRTDGPAVTRPDGTKEWWVDGEFVRREEAKR